MIDIYARTFRTATFLDGEDAPSRPRRRRPAARRHVERVLAWWRQW